MNSKAIRKQLLAAVAMVLVAAVALGSSTYAWFVASGTVKAEGMKVQAKSEGGLAIRWAGEKSELWGTTASAKMTTAKALYPASTADLAKWTYAKASSASASAADASTYTAITSKVFAGSNGAFTENDYVVMQPFEIRSTAEDKRAEGLFVSGVTVTRDVSKDIDPAIRVGVRLVKTDGTFVGNYIYAPIDGHSTDSTWKDATNKNAETTITLSSVGTTSNGNSKLVDKTEVIPFDKGAAVKVQVFIWYEGEDKTLFSNNYAANDLNVTVEFSSYGLDGTAPSGGGTQQPATIDLTSATVDSTGVTAKKPGGEESGTYYKINGITEELYTDSDSSAGLTSGSKIYTITGDDGNKQASDYTGSVTLPT